MRFSIRRVTTHGAAKTNQAFYADWIGVTKIVFTGYNTNDQKRFSNIDNLRISGVLEILTTALPTGLPNQPAASAPAASARASGPWQAACCPRAWC